MARYLVTGMTSRQANAAASVKDVTFAHLISEALRARGHEVEHRNPSVEEDVSSFDRVIVGIAPLHALGSNRVYGAISAMMRTWESGKLVMMIDDPDTGKIFSGIRTMVDNPARLTKPFFAYKLEHAIASENPWKDWLAAGVRVLRDSKWPPVIVPMNAWAGTPRLAGAGDQVPEVIGIDPTAAWSIPNVTQQERRSAWTVEAPAKAGYLQSIQPFLYLPVERHGTAGLPRFTSDGERMRNYSSVRGVIAPPVLGGSWWTSRPALASACGALVLTDWQTVRPLGDAWTLTSEKADRLADGAWQACASRQREQLLSATPSLSDVGKSLENVR